MDWLIAACSITAYSIGARSILENKYKPSLYTRAVWLLISINSFASVVVLKNSSGIKAMVTVGVLGNVVILLLALKRTKMIFGITEALSSLLLLVSLAVWLLADIPFLNLSIGLIASFIGGLPTLKKVIKDPHDEDLFFWFWFLLSGVLAWASANHAHLSGYLYAAYNGSYSCLIYLLCLRRYLPKPKTK